MEGIVLKWILKIKYGGCAMQWPGSEHRPEAGSWEHGNLILGYCCNGDDFIDQKRDCPFLKDSAPLS
jgi:hypothetical protein